MIGKRIRLARQLAGLTQEGVATALSQAGVSATKQAISNYETGKREPSARVLLELSSLFGVRTEYFFYVPDIGIEWLAYRRRSTLAKTIKEAIQGYAKDIAALYFELRRMLYPDERAAFPQPRNVTDMEGAEAAAQELRCAWKLHPRHPIENLTLTAETNGVIVIGWNKQTGRFDGLSGWLNDTVPITVVNTDHQVDRRRFSLAHELGHLLMHTSDDLSEKLAHRFAAALLVPREAALHELGKRRPRISLKELGTLKRRYGLSIQGWIYRAKDLGIISKAYADTLWPQINMLGWKKEEPAEYAYVADEEPILLEQMIQRGLDEQLVDLERMFIVYPDYKAIPEGSRESEFPSARELLEMPEAERQHWIDRSITLAQEEEFEIFEAYGEEIF